MTRSALVIGTLVISWLGMMIVHEAGHVVGAWATGGTVRRVILHPLQISRTDILPNPSPLVVVWAGPILGVAGPLLFWGAAHRRQCSWSYLARFFAGFCCVANGAYIGAGVFLPVGDAKAMLDLGSPVWILGAFAVFTIPVGFFLWNGEGRHFGLGTNPEAVNARHTCWIVSLLTVLILAELWLP